MSSPGATSENQAAQPLPLTRICPESGWVPIDLAQLWRYRELLGFFAWRDIKVRYKQTELGIAWAIIQPLMTTGVFAVLFGLFMGAGNEPGVRGIPYALSTFCAMLPWHLFSESMTRSSESLLEGKDLITKVYFPRMILPLAAVVTGVLDFLIGFVVLALMVAYYVATGQSGVTPSWPVLALPGFALLAVMASSAVGLWFSALSAIYRDFRYVLPFLAHVGFYLSPVVYSTAKLREALPESVAPVVMMLYGLNPMVGVIEGFRWALLDGAPPPGWVLVPSIAMTFALLISGMYFFRRMERTVVDVI